jgi:hypothetical protein
MAHVNYRALLNNYERRIGEATEGVQKGTLTGDPVEYGCALMESEIKERFDAGDISTNDFDLGKLFAEAYGDHHYFACRKNGPKGPHSTMATTIMEAAGGVTTAAFANITGQIIYNRLMEGYTNEEFVFTKLIPEYQTEFSFEKMAMVTPIGDKAVTRGEAEPYAIAGLSQDWIRGPVTEDRGFIVPVTWEAIFFDRTGQLTREASEVGHAFGLGKEKRAVDAVIDENAGAKSAALGGHRLHWRDVDIGATYNDNTGNHTFDNLAGTNTLIDWTSVDTVDQLFNQILDPNTNEPVAINPVHLIAPKGLEKTATRIQKATTVRVTTPGFAVSANPNQTEVANPYAGKFEVISSRYLYNRMATKTSWYYGDVRRALLCFINRKMDVQQAPSNNAAEFERRIVMMWRASEHSNFGTVNSRYLAKSTVA